MKERLLAKPGIPIERPVRREEPLFPNPFPVKMPLKEPTPSKEPVPSKTESVPKEPVRVSKDLANL